MSTAPTEGNTSIRLDNWWVNVTNIDRYHKKLSVFIDDPTELLKLDAIYTTFDAQDALTNALKFSDDGSQYFYNHKHYNYKLEGSAFLRGKTYDLSQGDGMFDWGRGIWPYKAYWIWSSGNGRVGETVYSINLGYGM
jgi:hypothetical protein